MPDPRPLTLIPNATLREGAYSDETHLDRRHPEVVPSATYSEVDEALNRRNLVLPQPGPQAPKATTP